MPNFQTPLGGDRVAAEPIYDFDRILKTFCSEGQRCNKDGACHAHGVMLQVLFDS